MASAWATLTEARSRVRWQVARAWSSAVYPHSFAAFGHESVIVSPIRLRNVGRISVGDNCAIYEGAWLQAEGPDSWLEIGDDCYLGLRAHVHAVGRVVIGRGCMLADDVLVNDSEHVPGQLSSVRSRGEIRIGDDVFLGVRSVVLGGVTIGSGAMVGAGAVVTRDVPEGAVVAGVPARQVGAVPGAEAS